MYTSIYTHICIYVAQYIYVKVTQSCLNMQSMEFSRPVDFPNPGIAARSPTLQADSLPSEPPGKFQNEGFEEKHDRISTRLLYFYDFGR